MWLSGTVLRKSETYLLHRLVCVHVHVYGVCVGQIEMKPEDNLLSYTRLCVYVHSLFVSKMQSKSCMLSRGTHIVFTISG